LAQVGVLGGVSGVTELEGLLGVCDG